MIRSLRGFRPDSYIYAEIGQPAFDCAKQEIDNASHCVKPATMILVGQ